MTRDLASPMLARSEKSSRLLISFFAGLVATLDAEGDDGALAVGEILLRALMVAAGFEARIVDPLHAGMLLEVLRDSERVLEWRSRRRWSVSMPAAAGNALNGESAAPVSRSPWTRALRMNASGPKALV